ncbi:protocadherin alpha-2-like [Puntigrus tetrazona]|uniref:protocadherin alpha-2-like n=1 Tax=Puntigrus tetrazona TaxID=1606681 RepID=UPI001C892ECB|nr:protocadherin alpha-2-like [Puntigrus tetrazona]
MDVGGQWSGPPRWWIVSSLLLCVGNLASAQIKYNVPEEVKEGQVIGNIAKDLNLDAVNLSRRRFRIVSGSGDALFQVNQNNGELYVDKRIDRERLCDGNAVCSISLKCVIEDPLEVHYVEVEITDVNDNPPIFPRSEQQFEIAEHTLLGTRFQVQTARDPDLGMNAVRQYKLSQNELFDVDVRERHEIKIPFLVLKKALDRERQGKHRLSLTAIDGGNPPKSGTLNISIIVLDINDNRPVFSRDSYTATILENAPRGTVVIKINATDLDEGMNGEIEFSLGENVEGKIHDLFALDKNTGELQVNGKIDFEDSNVFKLDVQASDKGQPPLIAEAELSIKVTDVNDNSPDIEITSLSSVISENASPGTAVALISVSDKDSGVNGRVICTLPENMPFELKSSSFKENIYSLVTKGRLDREVKSRYEITVTATDLGKPPLSSFKMLNIQVSDVNDNAPEFSQNTYELYLSENNVPGSSIFSVTAFDRDLNENAAIAYHLNQGDLTSFLNINSETGIVYALKSLDFETTKTFHFQVVATDSGAPSLSSNVTVNVFILDQERQQEEQQFLRNLQERLNPQNH